MSLIKLYTFAAICLVCSAVSSHGASSDQIKLFLRQAVDYSINAAFQSSNPASDGVENGDIRIYSAHGKIRIDHPVDQRKRNQTIIISPPPEIREQVWLTENGKTVDNLVLERLYPTNWSWWPVIYAMTESHRLNAGYYRISDAEYRGIPCYKISVKYKNNDATIAHASPWHFQWKTIREIFGKDSNIHGRKLTQEEFEQNIPALKPACFSAIELWIDRTPGKPFIYGYQAFGVSGNILAAEDWGTVSFLQEIDPEKLLPPPKAKVKAVQNNQEFSEAYIANFTAGNLEPPSAWANLKNWCAEGVESLWINILQYGGRVAFWLAVVLVAVVVILKIRNKRMR